MKRRVWLLVFLAALPVLVSVPAAQAATMLRVTPVFPAVVVVGQNNVAASILISNTSTSPDTTTMTVNSITVTPSCGTGVVNFGVCPSASADPGVFQISPTGSGEAGTACAGQTFTTTPPDPMTGQVSFTPSTSVVLDPAGSAKDTCAIDFTFKVLKAPTKPSGSSPPDTVLTDPIAFAQGYVGAFSNANSASGVIFMRVSKKAIPTIATTPSGGAAAGGTISAMATLSGGSSPTGNVRFQLFGPNTPPCIAQVATTTGTLTGGSASSGDIPVPAAGTYTWMATYNGDASNLVVPGSCSSPVTVTMATPTIATTSGNAVVGGTISDQATVSGGSAPSGSVTFQLYGPGDPSCAAPAIFAVTGTLTGGVATTGAIPATTPGTYHWTAAYSGDANNNAVASPCASEPVTVTSAPGYWEVASDGGIFNFGSAGFFGSAGATKLNKPIVGIAASPDGQGYWEVASDGGIFNYGSAKFFGSAGGSPLNKPIVGIAASPDGQGYWEVASDGGIFNYGSAKFFGSAGGSPLNKPIVSIAAAPDGQGYWEVASDGGIFNYGSASFFGSTGAIKLNKPIVAIARPRDGQGYWEVASDGGLFNWGSATFFGSMGGSPLNKPIVGAAGT